ncbi:phosphopantetheine-binding protein [Kutzneria sp. NPDC052558]|uniref:phosphopantetheine-binding protein n=1 Tax=Kutzneria sp. NPDC052558 TaxID=3364121 RepID=UPI0037CA5317
MQLTRDVVCADIAEQLYMEPEEVAASGDLFGEGLDSVGLLTLVERWRELGAEVAFVDLAERPTLEAWWQVLSRD